MDYFLKRKENLYKDWKGQNKKLAGKKDVTSSNGETYKWFLTSLIIIATGVACTNQIFIIFLGLSEGLNMGAQKIAVVFTAWTFGGMLKSLFSGWLADRVGRTTLLVMGFILAIIIPLFYGRASDVLIMALAYGIKRVAFWTIQTVGFTFAGDIISQDKRGRLFSRYNTVMALSWDPAGLLVARARTTYRLSNKKF